MRKVFTPRSIVAVLVTCFVVFTLLSWILVFRDPRALIGTENFYSSVHGKLMPWYFWLLERSINLIPTLLFTLVAVLSFVAYFFSLRSSIGKETTIKFALAFQLIAFLAYPILSTDIFSYIFSDRVFTEYGQNIWKVTPDTYPEDKFFIFADWKDQTKVYGALNQIVYLPAAYLGQDDLVTTVILYKLTAAVFALAALWVTVQITKELPEKQQGTLLRALFWNPLFVLEFSGNGHNDIIMIFFLLLSLLLWKEKKWLGAGIALAAAVQIKMIPVVFFGFFAWHLLQKRNWKAIGEYAGGFILVNALAFAYMQVNPVEFLQRVLYNTSVYWQSLPALFERFVPGQGFPFSLLFGAVGIALLILQWRQKWHPIFSSAVALLTYLLFFTAAYWNWYVLWLLFLIPFLKQTWLKNTILAFTVTSFLAYPLLWLGQRYTLGNERLETVWMLLTYLWLMGVPVTISILSWKKPELLKQTFF